MKLQLAHLGTTLMKFHRELLQVQSRLAEKTDNRQYTPYDLLKLTLSDHRFTWLKIYSDLIIQIDIITDDKKNTPFDAHAITASVKKAIAIDDSQPEEFRKALQSESALLLSLGAVRKALIEVEKTLKELDN